MSLKVIAGKFKGRNLKTSLAVSTRPLLARAKKSLFDILTPIIDGAEFLDVFAGFGSVGIEALSRGAEKAVFIECDRSCVKIIRENLETLKIAGKGEVLQLDAMNIGSLGAKFDIIFIGPPYAMKAVGKMVETAGAVASDDCIIIGQHQFREVVPEKAGQFSLYRQEKYGDMRLSFYKRAKTDI